MIQKSEKLVIWHARGVATQQVLWLSQVLSPPASYKLTQTAVMPPVSKQANNRLFQSLREILKTIWQYSVIANLLLPLALTVFEWKIGPSQRMAPVLYSNIGEVAKVKNALYFLCHIHILAAQYEIWERFKIRHNKIEVVFNSSLKISEFWGVHLRNLVYQQHFILEFPILHTVLRGTALTG